MEGIRIQVVPLDQIAAERIVVAKECSAACPRIRAGQVLSDVVAGVEHQRGAPFNANIADAKEQGAR